MIIANILPTLCPSSPLARLVFPTVDDNLLKYNYDDNQRVEPEWYIPIIPTVLVNGAEGIGTGWASKIPNYNIREIVGNIHRMLNGDEPLPMVRTRCGCFVISILFPLIYRTYDKGVFFFSPYSFQTTKASEEQSSRWWTTSTWTVERWPSLIPPLLRSLNCPLKRGHRLVTEALFFLLGMYSGCSIIHFVISL